VIQIHKNYLLGKTKITQMLKKDEYADLPLISERIVNRILEEENLLKFHKKENYSSDLSMPLPS
jgi:hypothetical protein